MKIGDWAYVCCERDLEQIVDAVRLAEIIDENAEHQADFGTDWFHVFATREEAMADMGPDGWISAETSGT